MHLVHVGDVTVANGAIEPSLDMPLVIKVDISRHGVDLDPGYGLFLGPEIPYLGDLGLDVDRSSVEVVVDIASRNMRMATHASLNGRDAGVRGHIDKAMAILTWNLILAGVYLVAESYRLNGSFVAALCISVGEIKSGENEDRQYRY